MPRAQCGERNGRAKLTDGEVDLLRELFESERNIAPRDRHWTYARLATTFEISKAHAEKLVRGERR